MSKKKTTPAPPTVLVITLNTDGSGSLLARRGDLAHLSQFQYHGLPEIVTAIQTCAAQLITVEKNPPPLVMVPPVMDVTTSTEINSSDALNPESEDAEALPEQADPDSNDVSEPATTTLVIADVPPDTTPVDLVGVTTDPNSPQLKLI